MLMTHCYLLKCPNGRWTFVGRVPHTLCRIVPADLAAVMGGRSFRDQSGAIVEAKVLTFATAEGALAYAVKVGEEVRLPQRA